MEPVESFIDFRELAWKARQHLWLIALPIVTSLCVAFLYLKTASPIYESFVIVSVGDRPAISGALQSIVNPDRSTDNPRDRVALLNNRVHQTGFLTTLAGRLGTVADPSVRAEARARVQGLHGISADELAQRMTATRLGQKIKILPEAGSGVSVRADDPDPRRATDVATAVVQLLLEQTRQGTLERAQARGAFSSDQIAVYQERLHRSEDALRAFQESLIGRNIQASVVNDANLDIARSLIRSNSEEMDQIRGRLRSELDTWNREGGGESSRPDLSSSNAASIEARLEELEVSYALAQLGGEKSAADAASLKSRVSEAREELYSEYLSLAQAALADYPEGARLAAAGTALDRSVLRTLKNKGDRLSSVLRAFTASVQSSPRDQIELERLRSAVDMNRQLLGTLQKEVTSSRLSEALETSELGLSIEVLEPAQVPLGPIFPDRTKTLGLAFLLGPLMGLGLVFAVERLGGVIRSVDQVERETGVPVIGTVPRVEEWARPGGFLQNHWAALSILLVLLVTGVYFTVYSATHAKEQSRPQSSVGDR
jgi:uncharacterized protein involved in exopolysaccharide biosynthesis